MLSGVKNSKKEKENKAAPTRRARTKGNKRTGKKKEGGAEKPRMGGVVIGKEN